VGFSGSITAEPFTTVEGDFFILTVVCDKKIDLSSFQRRAFKQFRVRKIAFITVKNGGAGSLIVWCARHSHPLTACEHNE
jgi:hypothetical protein